MESDYFSQLNETAKSVAINIATAADHSIHDTTAGRRFIVLHVWLQAEGTVDVTFKSGTTAISGPIAFATNSEKGWGFGGVPVLRGVAIADDFVITLGGAIQVNGFALIGEIFV